MKYNSKFSNDKGDDFIIFSMEDYKETDEDVKSFSKVLSDEQVRKYITDDAMIKYNHKTVESLTDDILKNSALRWKENKEYRFLVRDLKDNAVGMIGVTLKDLTSGELWYYKTSEVPSFMYEALFLALTFLKQEGVKNLLATFEPDNIRSIKILTKLGFKNSKIGEMFINL
jgi:RimJ/RimL family protein N-acetyltransferase